MRRIFSATFFMLLGCLFSLLALELILRLLPTTMGLIRVADESAWPLHNYTANVKYTYSYGWDFRNIQRGVTNNFGHLSPFDFATDSKPVTVIGDSYIESQMNPYEETLQGQLGILMGPQQSVYGLGANGLSISDYLVMAQSSSSILKPQAQIFVLVDGDLSESLIPRVGWSYFKRKNDGGFENTFIPQNNKKRTQFSELRSKSAVYRYVRSNLGFSLPNIEDLIKLWGMKSTSNRMSAAEISKLSDSEVMAAIDFFFEELKLSGQVKAECTVFLVDADRYLLYGLPKLTEKDSPELIQYFIERARSFGMRVVELGPVFSNHFEKHHKRFDHSPDDRHWNRLGHLLAAQQAMQQLQICEGLTATP